MVGTGTAWLFIFGAIAPPEADAGGYTGHPVSLFRALLGRFDRQTLGIWPICHVITCRAQGFSVDGAHFSRDHQVTICNGWDVFLLDAPGALAAVCGLQPTGN